VGKLRRLIYDPRSAFTNSHWFFMIKRSLFGSFLRDLRSLRLRFVFRKSFQYIYILYYQYIYYFFYINNSTHAYNTTFLGLTSRYSPQRASLQIVAILDFPKHSQTRYNYNLLHGFGRPAAGVSGYGYPLGLIPKGVLLKELPRHVFYPNIHNK